MKGIPKGGGRERELGPKVLWDKLSGCFQQRKVLYVFNRLERKVSTRVICEGCPLLLSEAAREDRRRIGKHGQRFAGDPINREWRDTPSPIELEFS